MLLKLIGQKSETKATGKGTHGCFACFCLSLRFGDCVSTFAYVISVCFLRHFKERFCPYEVS